MKASQVHLLSREEQLLEAVRESNIEKLEHVLSYGTVDLSATDPDNGATALHIACKTPHLHIIKLLLENGFKINAVDKIQNTPLHLAAVTGHEEIVTLLLDSGADLTIKNDKNETAKDVASKAEIRQLIEARPSLRQFQQEQLGIKTASVSQTIPSQVDEDRQLAEQLQQQEFSSADLTCRISAAILSAAESPMISAVFPPVSNAAIPLPLVQKNIVEQIDPDEILTRLGEIKDSYTKKEYAEASRLIKILLKFCNQSVNEGKYREIEYECFSTLGDVYLAKDVENKDIQDYPKAVALYQYAKRMVEFGQVIEKVGRLPLIGSKLAEIEEKCVNAINSNIHYKCDPSLIASHKKALEEFRLTLQPRLNEIKELGVEKDELNEKRLFERAKIVEAIYHDIRNFFIGHEEGNKGFFVKLIDQAKILLGPVPHATEYAVIGLGSMARGTMIPWSHIKFAILIQEGLNERQTKEVKNYFYQLTTLLHISIINLGETELAAMAIKELNDFTSDQHDDWFGDKLRPDGVSFDAQRPIGCKTPLGRNGFTGHNDYALICTPSELAKYQDDWADREVTLQQLLLNTVLIDGNDLTLEKNTINTRVNAGNKLFNLYHQLMEQKEISGVSGIQRIVELSRKDTEQYDLSYTLEDKNGKLFDVKKEIYRYLDRIFGALSSYLGLYNLNQWDLLDALSANKFIDKKHRKNLLIMLSIACELRLSTYCNKAKIGQLAAFQSDYIEVTNKPVEAELVDYFKLTNTGVLRAFFYLTTLLKFNIDDYLTEVQLSKTSSTLSKRPLDLTKVSLGNTIDVIKGIVSMRLMDYPEAVRYLENATHAQIILLKALNENTAFKRVHYKVALATILSLLGRVHSRLANYELAIQYYQQAKVIYPEEFKAKDKIKFAITNLQDLGNVYNKLGQYKEAINYYEQARAELEKHFSTEYTNIAITLCSLGMICNTMAAYAKARQYFQQAKIIYDKELPEKRPSSLEADILNRLGEACYGLTDYPQAIGYYEQARTCYEKIVGKEHADVAVTLNSLGMIYYRLNNYNKAIEYFNQALVITEKIFGREYHYIAVILNNLGRVYNQLADYRQANRYYVEAQAIDSKKSTTESPDDNAILNNLGDGYSMTADYDQAINCYERAKIGYENKFGIAHPEVAAALNHIGQIYYKLGQYSQAINCHEQVKAIFEKIFGAEHFKVAAVLSNLVAMCIDLGDYNKVIEYCRQAKTIYEKAFDKNHTDLALILNKMGVAYNALADYTQAMKSYEEALAIYENTLDTTHPDVANVLNNLGTNYICMGDYKKGREYCEKAKAIYKEKFGPEDPNVAMTLQSLGLCSHKLKNTTQAINYYKQARAIYEKKLNPEHPNVARVLNGLGAVYIDLKQYDKAIYYCKKAHAIYEKKFGTAHPDIVFTAHNLGRAYSSTDQYDKAIKYYTQALTIKDKLFGEQPNAQTAQILYDLGLAYKALNHYAQQIACQEKMLAIEEALGNRHSSIHAMTLQYIGEAYGALDEREKQIEYYEHALKMFKKLIDNYHDSEILSLPILNLYSRDVLKKLIHAYLHLVQQNYTAGNLLLSIEYQEKANNLTSHRDLKHSLSCYYHIAAMQALENNEHSTYNTMLSKAKDTFTSALTLTSRAPITAALYTNYAMYLMVHHHENNEIEYQEIITALTNAQQLNDGSELGYGHLEKPTVIVPLQKLLETQNIVVKAGDLANYLMIKIYLLHQNRPEAERAFEIFKQSIKEDETSSSVGSWLLYNAAEELGYQDQAVILKEKYDVNGDYKA